MPIIEVKNVSYTYDKTKYALKNFNLSVEEGEYIAVIGHNGSGKSTLAKLLNALFTPSMGEVIIDGLSTKDKNSLFEIRKKVGVVFQNPDNGIVASIVEDDVAFGPENIGIKREEIGKRIDFALKTVGMEEYRYSSPDRLSGGQKQRIAIAGVLALNPKVLVLDESTAMLDPIGREEILKVVKNLNEKGVTVITITHYMDEVLSANRVIVLDEGEIAIEGTPKEIFKEGERLKKIGLELPLASYIAERLKKEGLPINDGVLDKEDLRRAICELT